MAMTVHGGPDGLEAIRHDFSTNASPLGPPPELACALAQADRSRYPDPSYGALRESLAQGHHVAAARLVPTAGTSEAIRRITLAARLRGVTTVWAPGPGYGDYAAAARALDLELRDYANPDQLLSALAVSKAPVLLWLCEPCNPTGCSMPPAFWPLLQRSLLSQASVVALDRAYEPLRLSGIDPVPEAVASLTWQCLSPNKSLGLPGVRAGYLVAPTEDRLAIRPLLDTLAPSWVVSAEGVGLLTHLHTPRTQAWLGANRATLADWSRTQRQMLRALGWTQRDSMVPFWLAHPGDGEVPLSRRLQHLRRHGVKLRDATSFGLPGWVRISAQPPASQRALVEAWQTSSIQPPP